MTIGRTLVERDPTEVGQGDMRLATVEGDALTAEFSAPAAGPPPWNAYRIVPSTVFALGTAEPYGATRFDL